MKKQSYPTPAYLSKLYKLEQSVIRAAKRWDGSINTPFKESPGETATKLLTAIHQLKQFEKEGKRG